MTIRPNTVWVTEKDAGEPPTPDQESEYLASVEHAIDEELRSLQLGVPFRLTRTREDWLKWLQESCRNAALFQEHRFQIGVTGQAERYLNRLVAREFEWMDFSEMPLLAGKNLFEEGEMKPLRLEMDES